MPAKRVSISVDARSERQSRREVFAASADDAEGEEVLT